MFWGLTLREFYRELSLWKARVRDEDDRQLASDYRLVQMWVESHTAKGYKMKPITKYRAKATPDTSTEGRIATLRAWADRIGVPVQTEAA